jgi:hypothetical protein
MVSRSPSRSNLQPPFGSTGLYHPVTHGRGVGAGAAVAATAARENSRAVPEPRRAGVVRGMGTSSATW